MVEKKNTKKGLDEVHPADTSFDYPSSFETEPFTVPHTVTVLLSIVGLIAYTIKSREDGPHESTEETFVRDMK